MMGFLIAGAAVMMAGVVLGALIVIGVLGIKE